ncbi:MAG: hypothetical protein ACXAD7_03630 [Candidatus Kariarchaeaceae archaeon]|jgi:hypothetical protein
MNTYYVEYTIKTDEHQNLSNERETLISIAERRWGIKYDNYDKYDRNELLGLAEYGDARAFWEQSYANDAQFTENSRGRSITSYAKVANDSYLNYRDQKVALSLGGFRARNTVRYTTKVDDSSRLLRERTIKQLLKSLSNKYAAVTTRILDDGISKLAEFCKGYYKVNVKKILVAYLYMRCKQEGLYTTLQELLSELDISKEGIIKFQQLLKTEGFFQDYTVNHSRETLRQAILNNIFLLREKGLIENHEMQRVQMMAKSLLDEHMEFLYTRINPDKMIAALSLQACKPSLKNLQISKALSDNQEEQVEIYRHYKTFSERFEAVLDQSPVIEVIDEVVEVIPEVISEVIPREVEDVVPEEVQEVLPKNRRTLANFYQTFRKQNKEKQIEVINHYTETEEDAQQLWLLNRLQKRYKQSSLTDKSPMHSQEQMPQQIFVQSSPFFKEIMLQRSVIICTPKKGYPRVFFYLAQKWLNQGASMDWTGVDRDNFRKRYPKYRSWLETPSTRSNLSVKMEPQSLEDMIFNQNTLTICHTRDCIRMMAKKYPQILFLLNHDTPSYNELAVHITSQTGSVSNVQQFNFIPDKIINQWLLWQDNRPLCFDEQRFETRHCRELNGKIIDVHYGSIGALYRSLLRKAIIKSKPILWVDSKEEFIKRLNQVRKRKGSLFGNWNIVIKKYQISFLNPQIFKTLDSLAAFFKLGPKINYTIVVPQLRRLVFQEKRSMLLSRETPESYHQKLALEYEQCFMQRRSEIEDEGEGYYRKLATDNMGQRSPLSEQELQLLKRNYIETALEELEQEEQKEQKLIHKKVLQFREDQEVIRMIPPWHVHEVHEKYEDCHYDQFTTVKLISMIDNAGSYSSLLLLGYDIRDDNQELDQYMDNTFKRLSSMRINLTMCGTDNKNKYLINEFLLKDQVWTKYSRSFDGIVEWKN